MVAPAASSAHVDEPMTPRVLLGTTAVVLPLAGLLTWSAPIYNPMAPRFLFAAAAMLTLVSSFVSQRARRHLHGATWLLLTASVAWFQYVAYRNGLLPDDVLGILILGMGATSAATTRSQVVANIVLAGGAYWAIGAMVPTQFPATTSMVLHTSAAVALGLSMLSRRDLRARLVAGHATLEERVEQRTHRLHQSMARLSEEMAERKRAEAEANAASQAKSRFLATMSHELRTPLNAVLGYAELIGEDLEHSNHPESLVDLGRLSHAAHQLLHLIDQVLDLTRVERGDFVPNLEPVDVSAVVTASVDDVKMSARHGNSYAIEVPDGLLVHADPDWLGRILRALLSNSEKFTRKGSITVRAVAADGEVLLHVEDTGEGMPEGSAERIFDRFTQLDGSRTRRHDGAGLGLAMTRELLTRMQGWIDMESTLGEGSTFRIGLMRWQ